MLFFPPLPITTMDSIELSKQSIVKYFDFKILWSSLLLKTALYFKLLTNIFVPNYSISCWWPQMKFFCSFKFPLTLSFLTNHEHQESWYSSCWGAPWIDQNGTTELMESSGNKPGLFMAFEPWEFQRCSGGRCSLVLHGNRMKSKIRDVSKTEFLSSHHSYCSVNIPPTDLTMGRKSTTWRSSKLSSS